MKPNLGDITPVGQRIFVNVMFRDDFEQNRPITVFAIGQPSRLTELSEVPLL